MPSHSEYVWLGRVYRKWPAHGQNDANDAEIDMGCVAEPCRTSATGFTTIRADAYFAFMTQVYHSSSIPTPSLSYLTKQSARNSRVHTSLHFGAVMKDQSQENDGNPYSPLMCILFLLIFSAASQLNVFASWF
jgi:hypothetical protein